MEMKDQPGGREVLHCQPEEEDEAGEGAGAEAGEVRLQPVGRLLHPYQPTAHKHQIILAQEKMEHTIVHIKRSQENVMCVATW